jgi:SAM-dependent methyltransferase
MHKSSYQKMERFVSEWIKVKDQFPSCVLDFGSQCVNGNYKDLFDPDIWKYIGVDQAPGKNVDIVLSDPYNWTEVKDESVDLLISGQALEHVEYPWIIFEEFFRVMKPNALCCIIAPSSGPEHRYPIDCWRFYGDGMRALCKHANLICLECRTDRDEDDLDEESRVWKDTILIAKKQ